MSYRQDWYTTYEELQKVVAFIDKHQIGGGVNPTSVRPIWYAEFTGPFLPPPAPEGKLIWVFDLKSGASGMCAGLVLNFLKRYPEPTAVLILSDLAKQ